MNTVTAMEALRINSVVKRAKQGISQSDLAQRAHVARQTVSKIESGYGNVTVDVLEKLAKVFACSVAELFEYDETPADDAEIERRAKAPRSEFVDAEVLFAAIDEANHFRYSRAGRPRTVARTASRRGR
jgi:putative transcriptional regulator